MSCFVPIRKAVIPAAGLGTRMFPVSRVVPKELLPIGGKPLIQYAIDEAVASGIEEIVVVIGPRKSWLESFLNPDRESQSEPLSHGKKVDAESLDAFSSLARITIVQQSMPLGLGDALLCAQPTVGEEPFAVILPDALIDAPQPALAQLMAAYKERPAAFVATQRVEPCDFSRFGMLAVMPEKDLRVATAPFRVLSIVEKPRPTNAPSNFGVFGRYLLTPEIFADLKHVGTTIRGEVQLTDALAIYCRRHPLYGLVFTGKHYDAGHPLGYLQSVVDFALRNPETGPLLREHLAGLLNQEQRENEGVGISERG